MEDRPAPPCLPIKLQPRLLDRSTLAGRFLLLFRLALLQRVVRKEKATSCCKMIEHGCLEMPVPGTLALVLSLENFHSLSWWRLFQQGGPAGSPKLGD